MAEREKLVDRARDELFSHINRCGVLKAAVEDQRQWMDETIEYVGERFPDLSDADLKELHAVGMRFCKPAIPHGNRMSAANVVATESVEKADEEANSEDEENAVAQTEDANAA